MKTSVKYFVMLAFATLMSGCSKDDNATQPNITGNISGSIDPTNGASQVLLYAGQDTLKATPDNFGDFEFNEVKPGNYHIVAKPFSDHEAPGPAPVTITAGKTEPVHIQLIKIPIDGLISVSVDGSTLSGTPLFSAVGNGSISISNVTLGVYLELPVITGPGTFTNANSNLNVIVLEGPTGARWETIKTSGTATLTVTSFDPVTLKGNATFSFSAPANGNGATGNKAGTNGSLKNARLAR